MKKFPPSTLFLSVVLVSWLASFWMTRSWAIARWQENAPAWLGNVPDELLQTEEAFCLWIEETSRTLNNRRNDLGLLLENPASSDQDILAQADLIAQTHAELLRGIGRHLKSMRTALPENQKNLLTGFCLQTLRGPMQRHGRSGMEQNRMRHNMMNGHSGMGMGLRRGRGMGCYGLMMQFQLTDEQWAVVAQQDPAFESDVRLLQTQLLSERRQLLLLLENQQEPNGQVSLQIENIIAVHNSLEKRLIDFVLIMRRHFTPAQQQRLVGLFRKECSNP